MLCRPLGVVQGLPAAGRHLALWARAYGAVPRRRAPAGAPPPDGAPLLSYYRSGLLYELSSLFALERLLPMSLRHSGQTADHGIDLLGSWNLRNGQKVAVICQCKYSTKSIPVNFVRSFLGTISSIHCLSPPKWPPAIYRLYREEFSAPAADFAVPDAADGASLGGLALPRPLSTVTPPPYSPFASAPWEDDEDSFDASPAFAAAAAAAAAVPATTSHFPVVGLFISHTPYSQAAMRLVQDISLPMIFIEAGLMLDVPEVQALLETTVNSELRQDSTPEDLREALVRHYRINNILMNDAAQHLLPSVSVGLDMAVDAHGPGHRARLLESAPPSWR
ncbi:hypothetical protein H696_04330 [Fonticula alba]|uniref:Restriction endonuclease type IV Mrr domain-containing protein n=1 Tax=Fonticula alba TaxID=691883 RepID=A0A058Z454_FONAL|nr:hypothetical protein H696_04330 [Fonticula alba]KCV68911.1 hypothetical protein H696_04330 [Fonticula alba]|eukprot:XP_009496482.1 hypothetical protein H696_04330 [Fonticula alba]